MSEYPSMPEQLGEGSFDRQFESPEQFEFQGASMEIWDIQPENEKPGSAPVLFVPGWGTTPRPYKDGLKVHSDAGRRVITLSFAPDAETVKEEGMPDALVTRAAALVEVLDHKGLDKVDAVGYSEGNIVLALATRGQEDGFNNFVLEAPPGLTGKEAYPEIVLRAARNLLDGKKMKASSSERENPRTSQKEGDIKAWVKGVGSRTRALVDAMQSGRADVSDLVLALHQSGPPGHEHGICIIAAADDKMVSMDKLQYKDKAAGETRTAKDLGVDGFYSVKGTHGIFEAQAPEYARVAEHALSAMEDKQRKQKGRP